MLSLAIGTLPGLAQADAGPQGAEPPNGGEGYFRLQFQSAEKRYRAEPLSAEAAWQFGRACFELAEFATNKTQRADLANQGIPACRQAVAANSNSAPAHYYLGLNYGQLARTKGLSALRLVRLMRDEWETARRLDEHLDHAGADRHLGLLYRDAPALGSIGDRKEARRHLLRAAELEPAFPENRLILIETYLEWNERPAAVKELKALEAVWSTARAALTGPAWTASWSDWKTQLTKFRAKLQDVRE